MARKIEKKYLGFVWILQRKLPHPNAQDALVALEFFYHENKYLFRQVLFCKQQVFATDSKDNLVVLACLIT